jgi:hypothetical protein
MSLLDAVIAAGVIPPGDTPQARKKRYSEQLSSYLAAEVAEGLRGVGLGAIRLAATETPWSDLVFFRTSAFFLDVAGSGVPQKRAIFAKNDPDLMGLIHKYR